MQCADAVLESAKPGLMWVGERGDLGMPKFLPDLPKPQRDRLAAIVEREAFKLWRTVGRPPKAKSKRR